MTENSHKQIKHYPANLDSSMYSFLVISGAMQVRYDQFHPLVQLLRSYGDVYSLGLPGHGQERDLLLNHNDQSFQAALSNLFSVIDRDCPRDHLIIIAYSIASIMSIKLLPRLLQRNPDIKLIFIASAFKIRPESSKLIKLFFNTSTYKKLGWETMMIKQHGPTWTKTVALIHSWFSQESEMMTTEEEIDLCRAYKDKMLFIIGDRDQPFNKADILNYGNEFTVKEVSGDHFGYFLLKKSWPEVEKILKKSFHKWNILRLE